LINVKSYQTLNWRTWQPSTMHRLGEIWHGRVSSVPNFTPIGATMRV